MNDLMIRNINRQRTTNNRYVTDSNSFWREELHARVEYLPAIVSKAQSIIDERISHNVWGFPVDEQSISNTQHVFYDVLTDYFNFVAGRRVWVYTETDGYWTEERISKTIAYAFITSLWDIGSNLLIDNYPLVADDLRLRGGKTFANDNRETYHDSLNKANTADKKYTQHDNTRNKIMETNEGSGSDTTNGRTTSNTTNIQDTFLSPQNQGVTPSSQSAKIMQRQQGFQTPDNMGVEEVSPHGNAAFTTATTNNFSGDTSTAEEGRTSTNKDLHNRVDERDYLEGNETAESLTQGENNVGAKVGNDTGTERNETLDTASVLQSFFNIFKERLLMEIDNRMLPYFLNMKIARFTDHRMGREYYD